MDIVKKQNKENFSLYDTLLWESYLPYFLEVYFHNFLNQALHESVSGGDILRPNFRPSLSHFYEMKLALDKVKLILHNLINVGEVQKYKLSSSLTHLDKVVLGQDFSSSPSLHIYFDDFNSSFNSRYNYGIGFPKSLEKALWWTLFNNLNSPLEAIACSSPKKGFCDMYLSAKDLHFGEIPKLAEELGEYCYKNYGDFILSNF